MKESEILRSTPLHDLHVASGARMIPFSGWDLPVQYAGVIAEHNAVRTAAGLFDVSHMGEIELEGPGALASLQHLTCNDVQALRPGQAQYTAMLDETGGVIDDLIVYRRGDERFLAVVNAANTATDLDWMRRATGSDCEIRDCSAEYALLALQGPRAGAILGGMIRDDLSSLRSFGFAEMSLAEVDVVVARTGYTGEDGFEVLTASADGVTVWNALMECGKAAGLVPVGLGARDTLRLEAGLLLHGNDMTRETSALEAGLGFIVRWDAGDFIGKDALLRQKEAGLARRQRGLEMVDRGIARHGHAVVIDGEARGEVTSGSFAPFLKKNIARAYLPSGSSRIDTEVEVDVRGRRLRAKVVKTPFYRRPRR